MPVLTASHAAASDDAGDHSERSIVLTAGGVSVAVRARYSQAMKAAGLVVVSGQGPFDLATGEVGARPSRRRHGTLTGGNATRKIISGQWVGDSG
jgi:enamine deaminase RidA (YjgF/YER057c/UK114 family)